MLGLIIFGTRGVTSERAQGEFYCPGCSRRQGYVHKACRRFFTLYFIPLIPLDLLGEYIECQRCTNTYKLEVLQFDPEADSKRQEAEFYTAMRRVLALISLADGNVDESELVVIAGILGKFTDRDVPRAEIEAELAAVKASKMDIIQFCREMKGYLNDKGCELVVMAAILVASADGQIDDNERAMVGKIASAFQMPRARLAALLAEASPGPRETPSAPPASPPS
jgi:tellurite resistance protein